MSCQQVREEAAVRLLTDEPFPDDVQRHLDGCASCRHEVDDLATLPGLLRLAPPVSRLPHDDLMLRRTLASARRERGRRRLAVALVAACALLLMALPLGWVLGVQQGGPAVPSAQSVVVRTTGTDPASGVFGAVELRPTTSGSDVAMTVRGVPPGTRCALVVVNGAGSSSTVSVWSSDYQGEAHVKGRTSMAVADIVSVELHDVGTGKLLWTQSLRA
ncbi:MAG: hypothetical protein WAN48_16105 [Actinomycetes bacterium]